MEDLAGLHERLAELSAKLSAADVEGSVFKQLTFPSKAGDGHPNPVFTPNRFRKSMGVPRPVSRCARGQQLLRCSCPAASALASGTRAAIIATAAADMRAAGTATDA